MTRDKRRTKQVSSRDISPRDYGGRDVVGDKRLDGVSYDHRTTWDEEEDVDAFLEAVGAKVSGRDFVNGVLTVWWS